MQWTTSLYWLPVYFLHRCLKHRHDQRPNREAGSAVRCDTTFLSELVAVASQAIFTVEAAVKLLAEGVTPQRYFDDGWNCMDFFIVGASSSASKSATSN